MVRPSQEGSEWITPVLPKSCCNNAALWKTFWLNLLSVPLPKLPRTGMSTYPASFIVTHTYWSMGTSSSMHTCHMQRGGQSMHTHGVKLVALWLSPKSTQLCTLGKKKMWRWDSCSWQRQWTAVFQTSAVKEFFKAFLTQSTGDWHMDTRGSSPQGWWWERTWIQLYT